MPCWSSREEIPHAQGKRNPSKMLGVARGHQRADTLKPYSQKTSQSNHTRTTALSNSMKLSHACRATQDGRVMVERPDRMWPTGEGNGKPLQYSCLELGVSLHGCSSKAQLLLLTLNEGLPCVQGQGSSREKLPPAQGRGGSWEELPHAIHDTIKTIALTRSNFVGKVISLLFNMLSGLVIAFLPRSNRLLISYHSHHLQCFWSPRK